MKTRVRHHFSHRQTFRRLVISSGDESKWNRQCCCIRGRSENCCQFPGGQFSNIGIFKSYINRSGNLLAKFYQVIYLGIFIAKKFFCNSEKIKWRKTKGAFFRGPLSKCCYISKME